MKRSAPPASRARPEDVARYLDGDAARLYELIWKRAVASQMESAEQERTTVDVISADKQDHLARHRHRHPVRRLPHALSGRPGRRQPTKTARSLPKVAAGDATKVEKVKPAQHFTEPPPRYSEASLVRKLEELGIGRPSTYATILSTLRDRAYVRMDRSRFIPEDKGRLVTTFLQSFFNRYVEYDFTADLEEKLDEVSAGELDWKQLLRDFWKDFSAAVGETKDLKITPGDRRTGRGAGPAYLPAGRRRRRSAQMPGLRRRPAEPEARPLRRLCRLHQLSGMPLHPPDRRQAAAKAMPARASWAMFPTPASKITLRTGRFGPYVQRAKARSPSAAACPRAPTFRRRSGAGAETAVAAARSGRASRRRQDDHREFRPLRALCRP